MSSGGGLVEEVLDIETDSGVMAVLRKRPSEGAQPVVMFHDGPGIRNATHEFARKLARSGFDVVVPDLYNRHGRLIGYELDEREADPSLVGQLWAMLDSLDDDEIQQDLQATLQNVRFDSGGPVMSIGFCVGARAVFRSMMRRPDLFVAGAMWHPSYLVDAGLDSPHNSAAGLQGQLFIGIGADDEMQPQSANQLFLDAVSDRAEVSVFPGAEHGYTWEGWPSYHEQAAKHSFERTIALFDRVSETSNRYSK